MKKILIVLPLAMSLFMFASCSSGTNTSAEKHDFLNVDFGMSTIELFEVEGDPDSENFYESNNTAIYYYNNREAFGAENATIKYVIDENGVVMAHVVFERGYADNKSYITEYNAIKEKLTEEWGTPENTIENESEFNFKCSWENKSLTLDKGTNDAVFLQVYAVRSDSSDTIE